MAALSFLTMETARSVQAYFAEMKVSPDRKITSSVQVVSLSGFKTVDTL
jgi:hypothetical protein